MDNEKKVTTRLETSLEQGLTHAKRTRIVIDPDTNERHIVEYDTCQVCGDIATVGTHYPPDFTMDEDFCNDCFNATKRTPFDRTK